MSISPDYPKAIGLALAQQFIAIMATAPLLDGGVLGRACLFSAAAHWVVILVVIFRRPSAPTRFDLGLIGFGFIPFGIMAQTIAGLMGRGEL